MTAPVSLLIAFLGLIASVRIHLSAVILGRPVSVPVLGVITVVVILALVALIVVGARLLVRDWHRTYPRTQFAT